MHASAGQRGVDNARHPNKNYQTCQQPETLTQRKASQKKQGDGVMGRGKKIQGLQRLLEMHPRSGGRWLMPVIPDTGKDEAGGL